MIEKIALQKKLITREQCADAMAACKGADNPEIALKDYFISKNIISLSQMRELVAAFHRLKIMKKNDLFGRIAVKLGIVDKSVFMDEMTRQKQAAQNRTQPRFIGEIWVNNQLISRKQLQKILLATQKLQAGTSRHGNAPQSVATVTPQSTAEIEDTKPPPETDHSLNSHLPGGIALEVDRQGMTALVKKTEQFDDTLTPRDIQTHLAELNIIYGVVKEENIQGFIRSKGFREKPFKIAAGLPPRRGKDARVEYYFDTDRLKASGVDEKGNIDFKDRGEIPWVEEGTLLAEKFPMTESRNGRTVFDHEVEVAPAVDIPLKPGAGVEASEEGLKLYAQTGGHPLLALNGTVQVTDTFTVNKDVNYQTGHINYYGNIDVKGTLKAGFRLMGQSVRVDTVDGGDIHARGDVTIINGVNDARIYARGNVTAKFIQNSKIYCMGNLTVAKEIVDCTIETSGAILIYNGEVISSRVVCNMGLYTRHLGTDKSVPNSVTTGVDAFTQREIAAIEQEIEEGKARLEQIRTKTDSLSSEIIELTRSTGQITYQMDKAREENSALSAQTGENRTRLTKSNALVARLDRDLNRIFDRIEKKEKQILDLAEAQDKTEDRLEDLLYEQANFKDWQEANPGFPVVSVTGRVSPGTVVSGPGGATREITEQRTNVKIKEVLSADDDLDEEGRATIQIHDNIRS